MRPDKNKKKGDQLKAGGIAEQEPIADVSPIRSTTVMSLLVVVFPWRNVMK